MSIEKVGGNRKEATLLSVASDSCDSVRKRSTSITLVRQACLLQRVIQAGYLVLVVVFILRCQQRSREWLTEKQLFNSGLDVCPLNAKVQHLLNVHYNIGKVAADAGDVMEAVRRYREALRLNPDYDQAMNNLANILKVCIVFMVACWSPSHPSPLWSELRAHRLIFG
ncbi:Transmembrane and TPR repeat-containing protein 4 [Portunus trituberculatus]|uniref:Transmembrane and TPR repeat-containing protein 4 n=1 Tax=Portunus trituberculatus TaxID=210409 RepID=A0A5B7EBN1_PORTR|nr:Transmembrane and TPR repeat-containing protein 4 [Portunus trituberculatus]